MLDETSSTNRECRLTDQYWHITGPYRVANSKRIVANYKIVCFQKAFVSFCSSSELSKEQKKHQAKTSTSRELIPNRFSNPSNDSEK